MYALDPGAFYICSNPPECNAVSVDGTNYTNLIFDSNDFYLNCGSAYDSNITINWGAETKSFDEQLEDLKKKGYVEVVLKWLVHKDKGTIKHICGGEIHDTMELNKLWHKDWLICKECNMPVPNKPFFLSEALK